MFLNLVFYKHILLNWLDFPLLHLFRTCRCLQAALSRMSKEWRNERMNERTSKWPTERANEPPKAQTNERAVYRTKYRTSKKMQQIPRFALTCRLLLLLSSTSPLFFPLPFPFLAKVSNPPSIRCTWRYLSLVLTENVPAVSCCLATRGIRLMAWRKFLNVSRSSLICLPLVGTLTISLNKPGCGGDTCFEIDPGKDKTAQHYLTSPYKSNFNVFWNVLSESHLWSALLPSAPVLPRPWSWFVTWEGRLWEETTANCISSVASGAPPSYPQHMLFPCAASLQSLGVSSLSQYHSLVRSHALVWAHPSELAEGKVWKLTAAAPTPKNLSQFLTEFLLEILLLKTNKDGSQHSSNCFSFSLSLPSMSPVNSRLADASLLRTPR